MCQLFPIVVKKMPPIRLRRSNIGRRSRRSGDQLIQRRWQSAEEHLQRNEVARQRQQRQRMPNLIEATILTGKAKGENVLIPRIPMIPTDMPFEIKRLQFPIRLAFAMSINKSQGQTLQVCGINLEEPCFSHGQLYVACSRVVLPQSLFIQARDGKTKNIVYLNVLR